MTASPGSAPKPAPQAVGDSVPPLTEPLGGPLTEPHTTPPRTPPLTKPLGSQASGPVAAPSTSLTGPDGAPSSVGKHAAEPSIGQLVTDATTAVSTLVRSEIELAKLELRSTVKNAGTGIGLFAGAAVVLIFSLTFGFIALAEGIAALGLDRWLAFLIVFVLQLLVVGLFVFIGIKKVKAVRSPEKTIRTAKETVDYLKSHKPQG